MIIVTGGAGFIGSHVVKKLNTEGLNDILVVDNLGTSEKWRNLVGKKFVDYLHHEIFLHLVEDDALPVDVEAIIHLGACSSTTERDAEFMVRNNTKYSQTLARWAVENDIRFIYASSASVYGDGSLGFSDEDELTPGLKPLNAYAFSKYLFDNWVIDNGLANKIVGLRFFNVYGPNEAHKGNMSSVVLKAYHQIVETGELKLFASDQDQYPDGGQKRDFVYVNDCAEMVYQLLTSKQTSGIYNCGTGSARTWNDLAAAVFKAMGRAINVKYIPMPEELTGKYQYFTEATLSKLHQAKIMAPSTNIEDGVGEYIRDYLTRPWQNA